MGGGREFALLLDGVSPCGTLVHDTVQAHQRVTRPIRKRKARRNTMSMTCRALAGSIASATLIASCTFAAAQTVELKVSHYLPPNDTFQKELVRWGEELSEKSGGRLKSIFFPLHNSVQSIASLISRARAWPILRLACTAQRLVAIPRPNSSACLMCIPKLASIAWSPRSA